MSWNQAPLIRLLLPFIAGISTAIFYPFQFQYGVAVVLGFVLLLSVLILFPKFNFSYRNYWRFGVLVNVTLFLLAYKLTIIKTEIFTSNHFSKSGITNNGVYVRVSETPIETNRSLKSVVNVLAVKHNNKWEITSGKALLYFQKNDKAAQLKYGDELFMNVNFNEVASPKNPGEFNYKHFLAYHQIYHQARINDNEWIFTHCNTANVLLAACIQLRCHLLKVFTDHHISGQEFAVGSALLLGYEDKLDVETLSAYSNTGVIHILSVSGMHVAIVYFVFNWLLSFFDKIRFGNVFKAILLILFLWFYAALTGISPSVLRAATMFTFVVIAKAFNRHTNIYNTLAASAFLLLLFDPFLIMNVGFQLSYLAVIGIVYIQPKIYGWVEPNYWLSDQIWIITSVSIAAQLITFPLAVFYFHQFPNYFLLSNLLVIPLSTAIIYLGIALFVFSKVSLIADLLAIVFNWSNKALNLIVFEIEKWPNAITKGISISLVEMLVVYSIVILTIIYFIKPKYKYLRFTMGLFILLLGFQIIEQIRENKQKKIIIYNIPKSMAIDFVDARNSTLFADTALANNENSISYHIKNNWADMGIKHSAIISNHFKNSNLIINDKYAQFYNKRIAIVSNQNSSKKSNITLLIPLQVDYLVISKNKNMKMEDVLKQYQTSMIIFDSSNPSYKIAHWKNQCDKLNQPYYSVMDSGALILDL
jgi:competence protein ComEC